MAFFNLTHLGVQDPIKSSLKECKENDNKDKVSECVSEQQKHHYCEQKPQNSNTVEVTTTRGNSSPINRNTEAQGSYVKYTERLTRHQRTENGRYTNHRHS